MKLLVLGGTVFLGRHLVEAAQQHGHAVTIFHRGEHVAEGVRDVEVLRGDRDGGLDVLRGKTWDSVIDTSGYLPRVVRASAELLADAVGHYSFVSTRSVYRDLGKPGVDESSKLAVIGDADLSRMNALKNAPGMVRPDVGDHYGALKVLCERAVEDVMGGARTLITRPGLIVGPFDATDRFTYWPHRIAQGGEVLAPGRRDRTVSFLDARDYGEWLVRMAEGHKSGMFDVVGPTGWTMESVLSACREVGKSEATFTWVDEAFLLAHGVEPWTELPLWVKEEDRGALDAKNDRALQAGLTFRSLETTARDVLAWDRTRAKDVVRKNGMKPEREAELLRAWHARVTS